MTYGLSRVSCFVYGICIYLRLLHGVQPDFHIRWSMFVSFNRYTTNRTCLIIWNTWVHLQVLLGFMLLNLYFSCIILSTILFVFFLLAIVLSVLFLFTLQNTPLVSSNFSIKDSLKQKDTETQRNVSEWEIVIARRKINKMAELYWIHSCKEIWWNVIITDWNIWYYVIKRLLH